MLALDEKLELLVIARRTLKDYLKESAIPTVKPNRGKLAEPGRTFVTLTHFGHLRGCVGNVGETLPLYLAVQNNVINAAFNDWRFEPLTDEELDFITIEISVLSPPELVESFKEVKLGEHGLLMQVKGKQGVFLPEVAVEQKWNLEQTLSQLCYKIGVPVNAWESGPLRLFVFTSEKFKEMYE